MIFEYLKKYQGTKECKKWNYWTEHFEQCELPKGAAVYSDDMESDCICACCERAVKSGEGYRSIDFLTSDNNGFGYTVCKECHDNEISNNQRTPKELKSVVDEIAETCGVAATIKKKTEVRAMLTLGDIIYFEDAAGEINETVVTDFLEFGVLGNDVYLPYAAFGKCWWFEAARSWNDMDNGVDIKAMYTKVKQSLLNLLKVGHVVYGIDEYGDIHKEKIIDIFDDGVVTNRGYLSYEDFCETWWLSVNAALTKQYWQSNSNED